MKTVFFAKVGLSNGLITVGRISSLKLMPHVGKRVKVVVEEIS